MFSNCQRTIKTTVLCFIIYWSHLVIATKKPIIIGLISKCDNSPQHQQIAMGVMLATKVKLMHGVMVAKDAEYKEIDICEDERILVKALDSILLDRQWVNGNGEINIKGIIAFMPEHMLKTTVSFLSYTGIKVFPLFTVSDSNAQWFDQFKIFHPIVDLIAETIIVKIIKRFGWKHSAIIDMVTSSNRLSTDGFKIENIKKELPFHCIDYTSLQISDQSERRNKLFERLRDDNTIKVIVVKGLLAAKFMSDAQRFGVDKYWVLMTQFRGDANTFPEFISITNKMDKPFSYEKIEYHSDTICSPYYENHTSNCSTKELSRHYNYKERHFQYAKNILVVQILLKMSFQLQNQKFKHVNIIHYHNKTRHIIDEIKNIEITKRAMKLGYGKCRECKHCQSQCETIGLRYISNAPFNKSISRSCLKCKQDLIESASVLGTCSACPGRLTANANQTKCYDPIVSERIFFACYILNTLGLLVCLLVAFIYYRHRETPVVRSSDFTLTAIQLFLCLLLFVSLPVLNLVPLSWLVCTIRPCIFGLLLAGIVSIVVCKAEKILIIFYTKRRFTQKDISDIHIRQTVIFTFLLAIDLIVLSTASKFPSKVRTRIMPMTRQPDNYEQEYCSSDTDFDIQIIYCMTLLLLAIAQGYRGRKLPSNYNEGNSIIVGAACAICAFSFTIWTLNTGKHKYEQTSMVWLSLCLGILLLMIPLYGPKMYIIVFLPHKNTKQHLMKTVMSANSMLNNKPKPERLSLVFTGKNRESLNKLLPRNSIRLSKLKENEEVAEAQV